MGFITAQKEVPGFTNIVTLKKEDVERQLVQEAELPRLTLDMLSMQKKKI